MQKKKSVFLETQFELRHIVSLSPPPPFCSFTFLNTHWAEAQFSVPFRSKVKSSIYTESERGSEVASRRVSTVAVHIQ